MAFDHEEFDLECEKLQGGIWEEDAISSSRVGYDGDIDPGIREDGAEAGGVEDIRERVS